ncbi:MAG: aminomethyl-transferring glycine dehydrogenase subunit GcvPA [Gammaproteobacteria bacterium]|nr:aminomethyl-transferring glycine dehydrogenase subunit GcvPA [Gammaproteobacteria bacterium]
MPFIPHTQNDITAMLDAIGVKNIQDLFDEIPQKLQTTVQTDIPEGLNEMEMTRLMQNLANKDRFKTCFIGAGAYEHHIPAAVWGLATRGEFLTAYTPYQAEASQGTLQLLYEYQTMMASLMGMEVSNASLYDGASALAEAILMAIRSLPKNHPSKTILVAGNLHPHYRQVAEALVTAQGIRLIEIPFNEKTGKISLELIPENVAIEAAALVIQQPNFFGQLEEVDILTNWAHAHHLFVIAMVNPIAMALFKEPGSWGEKGADIVCGEGQPLGIPLTSGGPYFGFMCTRMALVRQMPGRLVGRTVDKEGKQGFTLTLQAREQHIRRAKATSNICTNQGLAVTAATIFMSLLGEEGLRRMALASYQNTQKFVELMSDIKGIHPLYEDHHFHEVALKLPVKASKVIDEMAKQGIQAGYDLGVTFPALSNALLVCITETKTLDDIQEYHQALRMALTKLMASAAVGEVSC